MLDRPGRHSFFFRVPEGTMAFSVSVKTPRKGLRLNLMPPYNPDAIANDAIVVQSESALEVAGAQVTIDGPAPGVWEAVLLDVQDWYEFDWQAADQEHLPSTAIEVSAKILGASAAIEGQQVRVENRLAAFDGGITTMGLGGMRSTRTTLRPRQPLIYDIEVEQGQELLVAEIDRLGGADLDADLHLFDCTPGTCAISRRSEKRGAHERVVVEKPTPGKWKAVILTSGREQGAMELSFTDYYIHPKLGTLSTTDTPKKHVPGASWQARLNIWRVGEPRQGYKPAGVIRIMDPALKIRVGTPRTPAYGGATLGQLANLELKPFLLGNEVVPAVAVLSPCTGALCQRRDEATR